MRICMYTDTALPMLGGQEIVVDTLARKFTAMGHDLTVFAPNPRSPLRADDSDFPYHVARHPQFYSTHYGVGLYRFFLRHLHRHRPFDILHCHGIYPPGYLAALCRDQLQTPTIITSHGGDVREGNVRLARPVVYKRCVQGLDSADALVAISQFTREGYLRLCPGARHIVDIPNGVDLDAFEHPIARPPELDPKIQAGEYFLFLGRLKHRKGVDLLLQALANLPSTDKVQLVIAGEGDESSRLLALAVELSVMDRVRFVGRIGGSLKTYLLQNAIATVIPSRLTEAFPLVVLESYAASRPVIGTRIPGLIEHIRPFETGTIVAEESATELASAMRQFIADRGTTNRLGQNGCHWAQNYGWTSIAQRHLDLYGELLEQRQRLTA